MANANANAQTNANLKYDVNTMGYGSAIFMNKPDVVELIGIVQTNFCFQEI